MPAAIDAKKGETTMDTPKITTEEEALAAVKQNGYALQSVPDELKTTEICLEAVKSIFERALEMVPEGLQEEVRRKIKNKE